MRFRYGLFFAGFRRERFYWECIVALRKESIVVLAVFGPNLGTSQLAHVALIVILFQVLVQLCGSPYADDARHRRLQVLDVGSLVVCWVTMWSGYFFLSVEFSSRNDELNILTIFIIVINITHMVWLVGNMLSEMCDEKKDSAVLQKIKKRATTLGHTPSFVKNLRKQQKQRADKKAVRSFVNPTSKSQIGKALQDAQQQSIEMVCAAKFKKKLSNTHKSVIKRRAEKKHAKQLNIKKCKATVAQRSRRQTINRVFLKQNQSFDWKTNVLKLEFPPTKITEVSSNAVGSTVIEEEEPSIGVDEDGREYWWDPVSETATWVDEKDEEGAATALELEPSIGVDEHGREFVWDPVSETSTWVDEELDDTFEGVNPMLSQ